MSEQTVTPDKPLFSAVEIEQFEADDVVAGSAIGKMLSIMFLYTVLAMSLVAWLTYSWVASDHGRNTESAPPAAHDSAANHAGH